MNKTEFWLRGQFIDGICATLQPAAHALLQASEEIANYCRDLTDEQLWQKPFGIAAIGFHLKHIPGFLDRLLTYAEGNQLNAKQLEYLSLEQANTGETAAELLQRTLQAIHKTIEHYRLFPENMLYEQREVGRQKLPSTVLGLCFHAAEHTMRHTGQLLISVRVIIEQTQ